MSKEVEVIVVGGGPAGSAAAIKCAQSGLSVTIIEAEQFPREHPGETLHPGIEPLLEQLGVAERVLAAGFLRHQGNWVQWEGEDQFVPFGTDKAGSWYGFQAWRADFDALLLNHAKDLGVEVLQPYRTLHPIVSDSRVIGVITSQGALHSSFVIDAAGSRHWLARQLGLNINNYSPRLIAHYGYVEGNCCSRDDLPVLIADEQGWTWIAKVRPQLYQWTRLSFCNEQTNQSSIPKEFHGLKPKGRTRAADVTWRIVNQPVGSGYFIVGDAAAVLDPASSHGVLKAIMSGIIAGHLITQIVNHSKTAHKATQEYYQWVYNWFRHDVSKLKELYKLL